MNLYQIASPGVEVGGIEYPIGQLVYLEAADGGPLVSNGQALEVNPDQVEPDQVYRIRTHEAPKAKKGKENADA